MSASNRLFWRLDEEDFPIARELFASVFTGPPWNDDWSDPAQLNAYIQDLTRQSNSLAFGLFQGSVLVGLSMGRVKHWYTGTEYSRLSEPGPGQLLPGRNGEGLQRAGMTHIFLLTDKDVPAYGFYRKQGFYELKENVAFVKKI